MRIIKISIINCIKLLAIEGSIENLNNDSITNLLLEIQKYLEMLRELERMKYLLAPENDYNDYCEDDLYPTRRIDPEVAELADFLGYDGDDLEELSTDDIWERTGH